MTDIVMPRLSDSMTEGTVVHWLKQPGDHVRRGEPLVEIETDKATLTYESDVDGVLTQITVGEGQTVAVGAPIGWVEPQAAEDLAQAGDQGGFAQQPAAGGPLPGGPGPLPVPGQPVGAPGPLPLPDEPGPLPVPGEPAPLPLPAQESQAAAPPPGESAVSPATEEYEAVSPHEIFTQDSDQFSGAASAEQRIKASPIARRLANKLGVNIAAVQGSGPGGRVVKEDVEAAAEAAARAQAAATSPTQAPAPEYGQETPLPGEPVEHFEQQEHFEPYEQVEQVEPHVYAESRPPGDGLEEPGEYALPTPEEPPHEPQEPQILPPQYEEPPLQPAAQQAPAPPPVQQPPVQQPPATSPPAQEPALIPHFPPPPAPTPPPAAQPAYQQPPAQQPPAQQPDYQQPQAPQQPFPSPPSFVQGMTGSFPAIPGPQAPQQPMPQQPMQPQQPVQPQPMQPQPQQFQQQQPFQQQYQQPSYQPPPQPPPQQQFQPPQQPPAPGAATATRGHATPIEPTSAQQTVARRMAESKATAPEFYVETEVDMTTCVAYREQLRGVVNPMPSFNDFVIKASAQALRQYPNVNAAYKDGHFEQYSDVNIGIVVSATELLAVPTLFNVDQKGLGQIAAESHQLAEAVRTRSIQPSQMSGGTFSISNLGMYGVDRFTAILNPPQAAILAVGAINRRAVIAEDGMSLVIRQIMNMTLTCDHRILYGAEAAEFLGAIKAWLESPQLLQL